MTNWINRAYTRYPTLTTLALVVLAIALVSWMETPR